MKKKEIKKKEVKEEKVFAPWNEMSDKEMEVLFLELSNLPYWQAVLKFNRMQHENIIAVLASVDMFKNPTQAARAQGTDVGLFTMEAKVNNLVGQSQEVA
ncbi:MAG: hypothetical protein KKB31_03295 [Nanoarchaeota archaeon]|nr:hypothetical protein [Nanoarchaeota archaeon]